MKQINLHKYETKEKKYTRLYTCGVYHKGGYQYVSNSLFAICIKQDYDAMNEGKVLSKSGTAYDCQYPDFNSIRPNKGTVIDFDATKVLQHCKDVETLNRNFKNGDPSVELYADPIGLGSNFYALDTIKVFAEVVKYLASLGAVEVKVTDKGVLFCDNGDSYIVVMNCLHDANDTDIKVIDGNSEPLKVAKYTK